MTETLSEKLAKLGNIEAKYRYKGLNLPLFKCSQDIHKFFEKHKTALEEKGLNFDSNLIEKIYPDFESDTDNARFNFCRLLDIAFKNNYTDGKDFDFASMAYKYEDTYSEMFEGADTFVQYWLICFIFTLQPNNPDTADREMVSKLKQALASTDWRY